jgi:hypothetical protein
MAPGGPEAGGAPETVVSTERVETPDAARLRMETADKKVADALAPLTPEQRQKLLADNLRLVGAAPAPGPAGAPSGAPPGETASQRIGREALALDVQLRRTDISEWEKFALVLNFFNKHVLGIADAPPPGPDAKPPDGKKPDAKPDGKKKWGGGKGERRDAPDRPDRRRGGGGGGREDDRGGDGGGRGRGPDRIRDRRDDADRGRERTRRYERRERGPSIDRDEPSEVANLDTAIDADTKLAEERTAERGIVNTDLTEMRDDLEKMRTELEGVRGADARAERLDEIDDLKDEIAEAHQETKEYTREIRDLQKYVVALVTEKTKRTDLLKSFKKADVPPAAVVHVDGGVRATFDDPVDATALPRLRAAGITADIKVSGNTLSIDTPASFWKSKDAVRVLVEGLGKTPVKKAASEALSDEAMNLLLASRNIAKTLKPALLDKGPAEAAKILEQLSVSIGKLKPLLDDPTFAALIENLCGGKSEETADLLAKDGKKYALVYAPETERFALSDDLLTLGATAGSPEKAPESPNKARGMEIVKATGARNVDSAEEPKASDPDGAVYSAFRGSGYETLFKFDTGKWSVQLGDVTPPQWKNTFDPSVAWDDNIPGNPARAESIRSANAVIESLLKPQGLTGAPPVPGAELSLDSKGLDDAFNTLSMNIVGKKDYSIQQLEIDALLAAARKERDTATPDRQRVIGTYIDFFRNVQRNVSARALKQQNDTLGTELPAARAAGGEVLTRLLSRIIASNNQEKWKLQECNDSVNGYIQPASRVNRWHDLNNAIPMYEAEMKDPNVAARERVGQEFLNGKVGEGKLTVAQVNGHPVWEWHTSVPGGNFQFRYDTSGVTYGERPVWKFNVIRGVMRPIQELRSGRDEVNEIRTKLLEINGNKFA